MQINLQNHAQAFSSLEEVLKPANNVVCATLLLKSLYHDARVWCSAIARYHSWIPKLARVYCYKVKQA